MSKEYPYDLRYQTILGDVYLNNDKPDERWRISRYLEGRTRLCTSSVVRWLLIIKKTGQDSLYQLQLDTILMNDDVASDTKMELMRQCILQSEQTTKDSMQIVSLFRRILERPQQNADLAMLCAQYMITKNMKKESVPVLEQVLSLDPENKPARLQLLSYAIQDNELDEVVRIAKSALEYHPEALEFYYYLGVGILSERGTGRSA